MKRVNPARVQVRLDTAQTPIATIMISKNNGGMAFGNWLINLLSTAREYVVGGRGEGSGGGERG